MLNYKSIINNFDYCAFFTMTSPIYRNLIFKLSVLGITVGILLNFGYDIIHLFFESIHILFEVLEITLDNLVESLLGTGLHQTQTIVFYLMLAIGASAIYCSYQALLRCFRYMVTLFVEFKIGLTSFWQSLGWIHKIACIIGLIILIILKLMLLGYM